MYSVRIKKSAEKYLNKASGKIYRSIRAKIEELKTDPVPGDAIPLIRTLQHLQDPSWKYPHYL